ncbi:MAG: UDP-N-acetylglucosamine 1-carboxyvinyltransferase [Clostridia bacterium]|nr:UDP-N-acetylglucosamine 1-carboxyvinyltransferase [Clostridia bacterium]
MERFVIRGGNKLNGTINISGAKNAALPIIAASVFSGEPCRIENIPEISDVRMMMKILRFIGAKVEAPEKGVIVVDPSGINPEITIPDEMTRKLRASYYLLGSLLSKYGTASVALPGGCYFGVRPIDQHIKAFEALGASVNTDNAIVNVKGEELYGSSIYLDVVSVGATINAMLAAVMAKGLTVIENAAREPHIVDLANFLNSMGADVRGAGTEVIKIRGVENMHGCTYSIIPDQIEAGTYMVAAAAAGGDVIVNNVIPKHLESITNKLEDCGITVIEGDESVRIISEGKHPKACRVKTSPHPGFPTDMQPQFATLLCICNGTSTVVEDVWDNRFKYVDQLRRMGANIMVNGDTALITGVDALKAAPVEADDLRAGAAMVIAGLIAQGETYVENIKYIDRGYEDLIEKLSGVGADIKRVTYDED